MPADAARQTATNNVMLWLRALQLQYDRATSGSANFFDTELDATLFAVALRNVIRAVTACRPWDTSRIDKARKEFDAKVPRAVDVRDVLEHFDRYDVGKGKLQAARTKRGRPAFVVMKFVERSPGHLRLRITDDLALDLTPAFEAGHELAAAALEVVNP